MRRLSIWFCVRATDTAYKPRDLSLVLYWSPGINADMQNYSHWLKCILPLDYHSGHIALYAPFLLRTIATYQLPYCDKGNILPSN